MTKDVVPEGFTLALVLVDLVPVVFFGLTSLVVGLRLRSPVFVAGSVVCFVSGLLKVLWKLIVVVYKKNVWWLFVQMRIAMPLGFVVMLTGFLLCVRRIDFTAVLAAACGLPQVVFFALGAAGMVAMMVCAFALDSSNVKSNWIEQAVNGVSQICFFIGFLLA